MNIKKANQQRYLLGYDARKDIRLSGVVWPTEQTLRYTFAQPAKLTDMRFCLVKLRLHHPELFGMAVQHG